ncbi:MAG: hydroxyacid dehydrogenase [Candidatus Bathyarchaeia archaeon]
MAGSGSLPAVLCADHFYMSEEAMRILKSAGEIMWVKCKNEEEMISKAESLKPKVIISEYFRITGRIMDAAMPNLRGIIAFGVGYDHIDVNAASERGIYVANAAGANAESVAEHTFALILCLARKIHSLNNFIRSGKWIRQEETGIPEQFVPRDLQGKIIGIIGLGAIGRRVARIAKGFGMKVLGYDPYITPEIAREIGVDLIDLETLLRESDIITLHVPLTNETRGMIGYRELCLMKPTAYLINTSRGPVLDEVALVKALEEGRIAGAGLDVFSKEPVSLESPLLKFDNVIVTPHCAGGSKEALDMTALVVSEEAVRILKDQVPRNLVNRAKLVEKGFLRQ